MVANARSVDGSESRLWSGATSRLHSCGWFSPTILVLATAYPCVSFLARNRSEVFDVDRVLVVFGLTLVAALVVLVVVVVAVPAADPKAVAVALSALIVSFYSYGTLLADLDRGRTTRLALWVLGTAAFMVAAYVWGARSQVRFFVAVFLAVAVVFAAVEYGAGQERLAGSTRVEPTPSEGAELPAVTLSDGPKPNVYWFVFDEYGRADQLAANHGIDNWTMVSDLEDRGFEVTDDRYSSYPVTSFSIATVLNMDYVVTSEESLGSRPGDETKVIRGPSPVSERFGELGYRHLYSETGVYLALRCNDSSADECLDQERSGRALGEVDLALLELTPAGETSYFSWPRGDPVTIVEQALADQAEHEQPVFVQGHILSPHDPHWYTESCDLRDAPLVGADEERYANEMRCLNQRILEAVDLIESRDPGAIVVLQSDHGAHPLKPPGPLVTWTDEALTDRFGVLDAWRLPVGCPNPGPGPDVTANTFRLVFGCLEGRSFEPIEPRYFVWRYEAPEVVEEITDPPWESPTE